MCKEEKVMNLHKHIRKVLRETVNESTFFRRRVDMRLVEKEFYENLNYSTDGFISKLKKCVPTSIFGSLPITTLTPVVIPTFVMLSISMLGIS